MGLKRLRGRERPASGRRHHAESLETRRLFGAHVINGTDGNDTITVSHVGNDWHVVVNGRDNVFREIIEVHVRGLDGNDTITVNNTHETASLQIFAGSGDDTITIGGGDVKARIFSVHAEGDGGNDTVVVDDRSGSTSDYRLAVALPALVGTDLHFDERNHISLGDDVQVLRMLHPDRFNTTFMSDEQLMQLDRFEIRGGTGTDNVDFRRSTGNAVLDFNGGGGDFDHLNYSDKRFGTSNRAATLEADRFLFDGAVRATFSNLDSMFFEIDGLNDTFNVNGVPTGAITRVNAGPGRDTYNIGGGDYDANIRGLITVFDPGNLDTTDERDTIVFNDTAGTTPDTYHISSLRFSKTGPQTDPSDFQVFNPRNDDLVFNLNGGANTIHWDPLSTPNSVTINAGAGADTFRVGAGSIAGPAVSLNGDGGTDAVVFEDDGRAEGGVIDKDYTFTGGTLRYFENTLRLAAVYTYDAESVTLNSGAFDSTFNVVSTGGEATLTVNAGDGTDRLSLAPSATPTSFVFNGQGGADVIDVNDAADTIADTYTLTKTTFDKTGFSLLTFATVETLLLRAHNATNTFDVNGVAAGTDLTITAGNSPDLFRVGAGDLDSNISGTLELIGEQGGDRVVFDDTSDTGNDTYRLDGDGVLTKANVPAQTMQYRFVEHVELNGNPADNTFALSSVGFALDVTLRGFNGADTFDITPSARADILIEASDPTVSPGDVLRFVNAAAAGPATLTPNGAVNGTYTFASAEPVAFLGVETFPVPPAPPAAPDLAPGSDTGASDTDNITNAFSLSLSGRAPAGSTVVLFDGATRVGSVVASAQDLYTFSVSNPGEGAHAYAAAVQAAPSQLNGAQSPTLVVTVDRTAPSPADAPDLATSSDTGLSTSDDVTRDDTPTFTGRAATGVTVLLAEGARQLGSVTASGSLYTITSLPLTDGVHAILARFQDVAGNLSPAGAPLDVTIDTAAPTVGTPAVTQRPTRLTYTFGEDVPSIEAPFLTVVDLATGAPVPEASVTLDYQPNVGTFSFDVPGRVLPAGAYRATLSSKVADRAGNDLPADHHFDFTVFATPTARRVFFNNSAADGNDPAANVADDNAVATDKVALLPGQAGAFANLTSYDKGVNGVMVDLSRLPASAAPSASDLQAHVIDASGAARPISPAAVSVRRGGGASSADRLTLIFADGSVRNAWLRVTLLANSRTGLAAPDVFYFGNLGGDTGGPGTPVVNTLDLARVRANVGNTSAAARATYDFNRDGLINAADVLFTRANLGRALAPSTLLTGAAPLAPREAAILAARTPAARRTEWDGATGDLLA